MAKLSRRAMLGGGLATLALAGGGGVYVLTALKATAAGQEMTPPEVLEAVRTGRVLLVDVRRPDEWAKTGVAEGAVPIDLRREDFTEAVVAARASGDQPVAVICARGVRSRRMTLRLDEAGVAQIIDIPEGMLGSRAGPGWLERGLPVVAWNG
ncbi:MAG: rhodanese-like domain-containing protein [Pseudomonadota bacterium]